MMDFTDLIYYRAAHRRNIKTWIARGRSGIGEGDCDGPNKNWDTRLNFLNPMFEEEILGTYKLDETFFHIKVHKPVLMMTQLRAKRVLQLDHEKFYRKW